MAIKPKTLADVADYLEAHAKMLERSYRNVWTGEVDDRNVYNEIKRSRRWVKELRSAEGKPDA